MCHIGCQYEFKQLSNTQNYVVELATYQSLTVTRNFTNLYTSIQFSIKFNWWWNLSVWLLSDGGKNVFLLNDSSIITAA